jgi:ketosteroid isomerase-like protein
MVDHGLVATTLPRRSFLHFGAGGLAVAAGVSGTGLADRDGGESHGGDRRRTEDVVRNFFRVIQTRDTTAIWSLVADGGVIAFPFLGLQFTDFATFDATIGPLLAVLGGLTYSEPDIEALGDPKGLIAKYTGHAVITFNGKEYNQTYITEVHVRRRKIASYAEYFDTAVLEKALAP